MKQVRVSTLESFRRFRDNVTDTFDTEEALIAKIKGEFHGNFKTQIGTAFHYLIEHHFMSTIQYDEFLKMGVDFSTEQKQIAYNHSFNLVPFIPEVRHEKVYKVGKYTLSVTGCTDVLQGNTLRDTKCKFSPPSLTDYYDSYQWRLYLSIFGLNRFIYDIFEFVGYKDEMGRNVSNLALKQQAPFECISYENMETDINTLILEFCEWLSFRNLWHLI